MRALIVLVGMLLPSIAAAQTAIVVDLGGDRAMVVAFGADGTVVVVPSATILRMAPTPTPTPIGNPYPVPGATTKAAVSPLTEFPLSRADATAIANVYAKASARVGQFADLGELRDYLVDQGKPLGLKGKYEGLADSLDTIFGRLFGEDFKRKPTEIDRVGLDAVSWAIWEAGR